MNDASLLAKNEDAIGWLIFNNPEHKNAVTYEMWAALPALAGDLAADPAIRVVIVRGGGEQTFVSGADISQFEAKRGRPEAVADYNAKLAEATAALARL